jgi:hypothetical protein
MMHWLNAALALAVSRAIDDVILYVLVAGRCTYSTCAMRTHYVLWQLVPGGTPRYHAIEGAIAPTTLT